MRSDVRRELFNKLVDTCLKCRTSSHRFISVNITNLIKGDTEESPPHTVDHQSDKQKNKGKVNYRFFHTYQNIPLRH